MENKKTNKFLNRLTLWVEEKIAPKVTKFTENRYVSALRQAFLDTIPIMMIGSIFLIILYFPIPAWMDFVAKISSQLSVMISYTFGLIGLVVAFSIAYRLSQNLGIDPLPTSIYSIVGMLILSPPVDNSIPMEFLGGTGLFTALIVGFFSALIMDYFHKHEITIKMPKEVPVGIVNTFSSILPGLLILSVIWLVRVVLNFEMNSFILGLLEPLVIAGDSLLALNLEVLINRLAWSVGIHGYTVVQSVVAPFWTMAAAENVAAVAAGQAIPHIGTSMFLDGLALWSGTLIWPVVGLLLFSKLHSFRTLGKLNAPVGIFCIGEPILFGLPIILNPILIIPYIISGIWGATAAWFAVSLGLVTVPYVTIPMITPPILSGYLSTGGDWRSIPLSLVILLVSLIIWFPFIKAWENIRMKENPGDLIKS